MDLCQFAQICCNSDVRCLLDRVLPDPLVSAAGLFSLDVWHPSGPVFESVFQDPEPLITTSRHRETAVNAQIIISWEKKNIMDVQQKTVLPTRAELKILQVLWGLGNGTVEDVISNSTVSPKPNYKTTQTILRIMEEKGLVRHMSRGRVFVFEPCVSREEVGRLSVQTLLDQNFGGSPSELLINLLEAGPVKESELEELESLIRNYRLQKVQLGK
jgi:predicted transcriptional regulator